MNLNKKLTHTLHASAVLSLLTATSSFALAPPEPVYTESENYSLTASSDGSSKASGTSYGNVRDGDTSSYWSPSGSTGRISIKNLDTNINKIRIVEATGAEGAIENWSLVNNDTGEVLATGTGIQGDILFAETTLDKINFVIESASAEVKIAEFETYFFQEHIPMVIPELMGPWVERIETVSSISWRPYYITPSVQNIYRDTDTDPNGRQLIATDDTDTLFRPFTKQDGSGQSLNRYFTDSFNTPGTYYYWVEVISSTGNVYQQISEPVTIAASAQVALSTFAQTNNQVKLVWQNDNIDAVSQYVYHGTDASMQPSNLIAADIAPNINTFTSESLADGTHYFSVETIAIGGKAYK
ncbi:hypothetical protein [Catenovulum agarivorans]|uniref:hypothetical protein n=1 Tax=Catenovulum agarivorans TaxID=1172192 RepID=UPI0002FE022C|nr:hypothetical protein [Catenovulum agarivorans]